jgi:GH25 family lysozyme M1 (1,4-beta-N-acetylmuramidase)
MKINPKVVDLYHLNANNKQGGDAADFEAAYAFGIRGVIHKCTQGITMTDHLYRVRRARATHEGMLFGGYHFADGNNPATQARHFLEILDPDANTLAALDLEDNPARAGGAMSLAGARRFLEVVDKAMLRPCVIYSGNRIKELIAGADEEMRAFFAGHPLWLAQYGPAPVMTDYNHKPLPWTEPFLWQYTGDGAGPSPHNVPGIGIRVDISSFDGTDDELKAQWAPVTDIVAKAADIIATAATVAATKVIEKASEAATKLVADPGEKGAP